MFILLSYSLFGLVANFKKHDITWTHFCIIGSLWGKSNGNRRISLQKGPILYIFDVLFVFAWNQLSKKQWRIWWFQKIWYSCKVSVIFEC